MNRDASGLAEARHIEFETLGSTNAEALRLARLGEPGPLWITAREQSAGRGRHGRRWISPPGNLHATLLLTDPSPPAIAPQLAFVAGLAVHDALVDCAAALKPALALKWPNDVLLGGRKLAGILIESETTPLVAAAIGIGVNCATHPLDLPRPATDLASAGAPVAPESLLKALRAAMAVRLEQWNRGEGFALIRAAWLERACGLGQPLRVRLPEGELSGRFEGLDHAGRLLLRCRHGTAAIAAGDVFVSEE